MKKSKISKASRSRKTIHKNGPRKSSTTGKIRSVKHVSAKGKRRSTSGKSSYSTSYVKRRRTNRNRSRRKYSSRSALSRALSYKACHQNRNPDGTFAKGYVKGYKPGKKSKSSEIKTQPTKKPRSAVKTNARIVADNNHYTSKYVEGIPAGKRQEFREEVRKEMIKNGDKKLGEVYNTFDFTNATPETEKKVVSAAEKGFTEDEIRKMRKAGKIIVTDNEKLKQGVLGASERITTDNPQAQPKIILTEEAKEGTVTHEIVHQARTLDSSRRGYTRTAYPVGSGHVADMGRIGAIHKDRVENAEETATAAETELRTGGKGTKNDYWSVGKKKPKEVFEHDYPILRGKDGGGKEPIIGEKAIRLVNKNYEKTDISTRSEGDEQAKQTYKKIFRKRDKGEW